MKIFAFLIIAVALSAAADVPVLRSTNNYYSCDTAKALILRETFFVHEPAKFLQTLSLTRAVPQEGVLTEPITCLIVTHLGNDGDAGYVNIVRGLGYNRADIQFTSKWGKGLDYKIEAWTEQ